MIPQLKLAELGMRYGTKILAGLLAIGIVWGGYAYWKHAQQEIGSDKKNAEWLEYQAKVDAKSEAIIQLKQYEFERDLKKYKEERDNELNQYYQYSQKLERDLADSVNKRLLVRTKANNKVCDDPGKGTSEVSPGNAGRGEAFDWAELGQEDTRAIYATKSEVERMAYLCDKAFMFLEEKDLVE